MINLGAKIVKIARFCYFCAIQKILVMIEIKKNSLLYRYVVATVGLFLVSFGVAVSIVVNLGTAPLSCAAYVLNLEFPSLSVGTFIFIVNMVYMLVQMLVLRKNFKLRNLMQIPASLLFGYLVDISLWILSGVHPESVWVRLLMLVGGCAITAIGVSMEVHAKAWMLSAEMTVDAFSRTFSQPFDRVKVIMDSSMVLIAAVLAWCFFGNPFGSGDFQNAGDVLLARVPGVVNGVGTVIMAFLPGMMMKYVSPALGRFF